MTELCLSSLPAALASENADFNDIHQTRPSQGGINRARRNMCSRNMGGGSKFFQGSCSTLDIKCSFSVLFYGIIKCSLRPGDLISLLKDRSIKDANL